MKPIFLLGVGAQKAGTSFLHHTLGESPDAALSDPKEMHVFDTHFLPALAGNFHIRRKQTLIERLNSEGKTIPDLRRQRTRALLRHVLMNYDLDEYVRYFQEISAGKRITGDITPSYQILDVEHFQAIRALLEPHFRLRVVFLMRDPVDRIFSAMRMDDRNNNATANLAHERFAGTFAETKHAIRTDYPRLIRALDEVFLPGEVHYEFYESLFTPDSFARMLSFLELSGIQPDFDTRVNASPTKGYPPAEAMVAARDHYAPVYDYCADRFGPGRVGALWPRLAG